MRTSPGLDAWRRVRKCICRKALCRQPAAGPALMTFMAPILCLVIEVAGRPRRLFRFLCQSTVMYAALGLAGSHPDHPMVQGFEVVCGLVFGAACLQLAQLSFLGLAVAFVMLPVLHHVPWEHPMVQWMVYLPFMLILAGLAIGGLGLLGMQPVFFGYGFHF